MFWGKANCQVHLLTQICGVNGASGHSVNFWRGVRGEAVEKEGCQTLLQEEGAFGEEVGNALTLVLPRMPGKSRPQFLDLGLGFGCQPPSDSATRGRKAIPC